MSRNERKLREACKEKGIRVRSLVWEPVRRGREMEGYYGGWLLNDFHPIGYSTGEALAYLQEFGHRLS